MDLPNLLQQRRLLAIVRGRDAAASLRSVLTLAEEGVTLVEVSLTGVDALTVIEKARAALSADVELGAGTVLTATDARAARSAGASFIVTPAHGEGVEEAERLGLPVLAGAFTPTEVMTTWRRGHVVKLFPASLGGPAYLKALREPYPSIPLVPVGGVDAAAARAYLKLGAVAVGVGSALLADAPNGGDLDALRGRVRRFRSALVDLHKP